MDRKRESAKNLVALKRTINIKRNNYNLVREDLNKTLLVADWSVNGGGGSTPCPQPK